MESLWDSSYFKNLSIGNTEGIWEANGISIDSRLVSKDDLFIALKGPNYDGHNYVSLALQNGAVAAVVNKSLSKKLNISREKLVVVDDTLATLSLLAKEARNRTNAKFIGITGSVGKTTTKDILSLVLSKFGLTHSTYGNQNNLIGVPLTLSRMSRSSKFGVFELGMNRPGEIKTLSKLVRPDVVIITKIAGVHTEFFNSIDSIADAKAEIYQGLSKHGIVIIPSDSNYYKKLYFLAKDKGVKNIISFGESENSTFRLLSYSVSKNRTDIEAVLEGEVFRYSISLIGKHMALNSLAVLAGVKALGESVGNASLKMANAKYSTGRGNRILLSTEGGQFTLIDETYNASPTSVEALIKSLSEEKHSGRNILVLGDMLELGADAPLLHRNLSTLITESNIDLVFTLGDLMKNLNDSLPDNLKSYHSINYEDLCELLLSNIRPNDFIAIKGSAGIKMQRIVKRLESYFLDRDEAGFKGSIV